ncbi:helix-turn-helix domain-containing protein [Scytonema sp. UIC 10036]|uniref:helix-turn-helix domain-containing protein n=1 Tax=Scytonema sp. UIC 10036 TaxID=2304196 RepID=UPI001FAA2E7D|nr:helix-turn-helix domain-containing protein [Scytonema sp. UIC 10036]
MLDDPHKGDRETETNEIVTELSADDRHLLEMIQKLLEPCDRITYGERQREVAAKLGKSVRTVRRLVSKKMGTGGFSCTLNHDTG